MISRNFYFFPLVVNIGIVEENGLAVDGGRFLGQVQINYMHAVFSADKS
jgi:uncharacterized membrane protein